MEVILQLNLPKRSLIKINSCRIYKQVFRLGDMIKLDGKLVRTKGITGKKLLQPKSSYSWPNQPIPSPRAWQFWKKIIRSTFKVTSNYILPIELRHSNWIVPLDERKMKYEWCFSKEKNEIYHRESRNIERYFVTCTDNNNYEANEESKANCESIPNDTIPITHINNRKFQIKFLFKTFTPLEPNDFTRSIKSLLQWKQLLIRNYREPPTADLLIIIASNGSKSSTKLVGG